MSQSGFNRVTIPIFPLSFGHKVPVRRSSEIRVAGEYTPVPPNPMEVSYYYFQTEVLLNLKNPIRSPVKYSTLYDCKSYLEIRPIHPSLIQC